MDTQRRLLLARGAIIVTALALALLGLRTVTVNDNTFSRLATVYALVHHGTWYIDTGEGAPENPFAALTVDKVLVDGHFLSSKPPVLPLLMSGVYWVLLHVSPLCFDHEHDLKRILQIFTIVFGIIPFAASLALFARMLSQYTPSAPWRTLPLLLALAFGTQYAAFAPQFINHVPGAAACLGAVYLGLGMLTGTLAPHPLRFVAFGVLGGLTHTLEIPLTAYIAALGLALLVRFPRQTLLWGGLGLIPWVLLQALLYWTMTGTPLPVQTRHDLYLYENSPWRAPVGIDGLNEPKPLYAFHLLVGRHGTFLLFPVLLFGLFAALRALRDRELPLRGFLVGGGACTALIFAYYIRGTDNYGGAAYGFRWAIGVMPILLAMAAPLLAQARSKAFWTLFTAALTVSVYSTAECYLNPWSTDAEWTARLLFGPSM